MATLRELRKRLASISITKQLAGAMKTVSAAKYAKIETVLTRYRPYADTCRALTETYGGAMTACLPLHRSGCASTLHRPLLQSRTVRRLQQ